MVKSLSDCHAVRQFSALQTMSGGLRRRQNRALVQRAKKDCSLVPDMLPETKILTQSLFGALGPLRHRLGGCLGWVLQQNVHWLRATGLSGIRHQ